MKKVFKLLVSVIFTACLIIVFGCKKDEIATLYTRTVSIITETEAETGGTVTSSGGVEIIARGVCWSTGHYPTTADHVTNDGSGSGTFSSNITSLTPNTTYYVRAYATNSAGTAYGNEVTFTTPLTFYPGTAMHHAASFSIGTKAYIGLGSDYTDDESTSYLYKDFWEWDQATNVWTRKADFPGNFTGSVVSFSIGTKGYIGTNNHSETNDYITEFWEFDPATNAWTQKASLPTTHIRYGDVGFSIGNKGYLGTGAGNDGKDLKDFWEWDQATNIWTRKADFTGNSRYGAVGFSIGNKGYVGTGNDGKDLKDFWEWDQLTNVWTRKADFGGVARSYAVGFSIGNKAYIGTGIGGSFVYAIKDLWEWDQATNVWTRKTDFGGNARYNAIGFSIGNKGYIGTGNGNGKYLKDFLEFDPTIN